MRDSPRSVHLIMRWLLPILFLAGGVLLIVAALSGVNQRAVSLGNVALMTITALYALHAWMAHRRRSKKVQAQLDRFLVPRSPDRSAKIIPFRRRRRPAAFDDSSRP